MPAYNVTRTKLIAKTLPEVLDFISDFQTWPSWSPWLIMEPECSVRYHGTQGDVGAGYHWLGELVGEGRMTLQEKTDRR